jgi:hypothetical protein
MATKPIDRRTFICTGATVCGACVCSQLPLAAWAGDEPIDPRKLTFCGYTCPEDCKFLRATLDDDLELKKEVWKEWKIEEHHGLAFDEKQAFCYGCKAADKPDSVVLANCDVRPCARERKLEACIQCDDLATCDKKLWARFPKFHTKVVEMQQRYRSQA